MFTELVGQQQLFLLILVATFVLLFTEWIKNDVVAILVILALAITRLLKPSEALSGFGSEPAIIVASIFVISEALHQTGVSEAVGMRIGQLAGKSYANVLTVIMLAVSALSALTHHVTTTAMMLPVTINLAQERKIPSSKLLMPLSFAASLGTTITIIGAPAFLVASATLQQAGYAGLTIFSIAPVGITLSLVGVVFMVLVGQFMLPSHEAQVVLGDQSHLMNYFTELIIKANAPFIGKTLAEIKENGRFHFTVVGWMRDKRPLPSPFTHYTLLTDDVLLVHTTPDDLVAFRHERGLDLHAVDKYKQAKRNTEEDEEEIVQTLVAANSDFIGRNLREIDFRRRYGAIVIGFWRQGEFLQEELAEIRLQGGDILVLQGNVESLVRVERDPAFLMLVPFHGKLSLRRKAPWVVVIVLTTILVSAFAWLPLEIAMLGGATALVLTECLSIRQAYRAIDTRIYIFIAGAIPLGLAMQQTGTAVYLANLLEQTVTGWATFSILLALYLVTGLLTQIMSDAATVALFAPIAIALAQALGDSPQAYVITVAMAAVTASITPTGHHGNLLVYGPGRYRFSDFVRVGGLLTLVVAFVVAGLTPLLWP
jgi:di/tricarboxylate transporter